ncbi:Uncharacterized protein SCF082_LOCUS27859 [Durusdinium trenchii]|uniref:Sodium/hydrogen exchanger n=1 Tax=Durusdinium trenchii TaxID=1381693 RepID=A0ABP0MKE3_9DINO
MTDESSSASGKQKLFTYTGMLLVGLMISQAAAGHLSVTQYSMYGRVVGLLTMFSLSFLMVGVGHEFVIERSKLGTYARDYIVAMSAAGLPWIFVALWLHFALPNSGLAWGSALLMARFAAPTSAGILFNMLEAAGFKETWLFKKAQVLAIFDDLDTILLMIPLKMYLVGFKWELSIDAVFVTTCLLLAWQNLHQIRLQSSWRWTMMYSALITAACEGLCFYTSGRVHIEVLLPAFVIGCMTRICRPKDPWCEVLDESWEESVKSFVSTCFMLLVGMSMPSLFSVQGHLTAAQTAWHVFVVSILMIVGKMMLLFCYRDEADLRTRLALSLGMCPRGEVGAGVIAISLGLGMQGPAVAVAVLSLAANLVLSTGFIMAIDRLMRKQLPGTAEPTGKPSGAAALSRKQLKRQPGYLVNGAARGLRGQNVRGAYAGLAPLRAPLATFLLPRAGLSKTNPDAWQSAGMIVLGCFFARALRKRFGKAKL